MPAGDYDIYLKINDPKETSTNRRSIQFANHDIWNTSLGANLIGSTTVKFQTVELVGQMEVGGEFSNGGVAHSLKLHLTGIELYEKQDAAEKIIKHMESFKLLIEQQKEK